VGIADGFLGTIVEVVAKRAHLRLELHAGQESSIHDGQQVPTLGRPEETGQVCALSFFEEQVCAVNTRTFNELTDQGDEAIELSAARDS